MSQEIKPQGGDVFIVDTCTCQKMNQSFTLPA